MTGASIPPCGPPKCTVTVESNEIHISVRAALSATEAFELIEALNRAAIVATHNQSLVSWAFRDYENALDHERSERNTDH